VKIACATDEVRSLSPGEVKDILDHDPTGEYILLDVRQPEEYEAGHIPGATLIPLGELEAVVFSTGLTNVLPGSLRHGLS
jgi:3-mercaptopyruvate sulfurtransferase SseA